MRSTLRALFILLPSLCEAQWEHTGPFGALTNCHVHVNGSEIVGGHAGLFKSTDGANTWAPLGTGLPDGLIHTLHYDGTVLYAGADQEGLYRSLDDGLTWSACNNIALGSPYHITAISSDGSDLLVSCNSGRFRSSDQGLTFTALGDPLDSPGEMIALGGGVLITRSLFNFPGYLYRSTDGGVTWQDANNGLPATPGIGALYTEGSDLYAFNEHAYRSTDQGLTWTQQTTSPATYAAQYSCRSGNSFYFSTGGNLGVAVTRWDLGETNFADITAGLPDTWTGSLFAANGAVYIDKDGSLYRSTNGGAIWTETGNTGMIGARTFSVLADGPVVLCGGNEAIHRSNDAGATWQRVASPADVDVTALYKNGATVLAGTNGEGLLRSTDDGLTWPGTALPSLGIHCFANGSSALFAGGNSSSSATVVRSADGGTTWTNFNSGLPGQAVVLDLLALGTDIFAGVGASMGADAGVYRSSQGAANWTHLTNGIANLAGTAFTFNAGYLYLGTEDGVYRSNDQGATWTPIGSTLAGVNVNDLTTVTTNVVAATEDGIFLLAPGASDWIDITDDLQPAEPRALGTGMGNAYLFVATDGRSVARRGLTTVDIHEVSSRMVISVFPNPVEHALALTSTEPFDRHTRVIVRDALGREAIAPFNVRQGSIEVDAAALTPGAYTVTLLTSTGAVTRQFVKQ